MRLNVGCYILFATIFACNTPDSPKYVSTGLGDSILTLPKPDSAGHVTTIKTGNTTPGELLSFANTLTGTPYKYGSTDPNVGFDCSGFITYVFNHFGIAVPRSSVDFTYVNCAIDLKQAKTGDLILFTGTDSTIRIVGHMGILIANPGEELKFIHSTSGKAYGVTQTPLNSYYMGRYMKVIRIFPQNDK